MYGAYIILYLSFMKAHNFKTTISALSILLVGSLFFNALLYRQLHPVQLHSLKTSDDKEIADIKAYLDKISPDFIADAKDLAHSEGLPSWGCGPTSNALAHLINIKFFDSKAPIVSSYDNQPYEIIERFGFADKKDPKTGEMSVIDHSWVEVYLNKKILFIDPTIGQFGKYNKIVYEEFALGDPNIQSVLKDKYGINDVRLRRLVKKAVDRVPTDGDPYPGVSILPGSLNYYLKVADEANQVDAGNIPNEWKPWVATLMNKYR